MYTAPLARLFLRLMPFPIRSFPPRADRPWNELQTHFQRRRKSRGWQAKLSWFQLVNKFLGFREAKSVMLFCQSYRLELFACRNQFQDAVLNELAVVLAQCGVDELCRRLTVR